jgi:hypothetical protein
MKVKRRRLKPELQPRWTILRRNVILWTSAADRLSLVMKRRPVMNLAARTGVVWLMSLVMLGAVAADEPNATASRKARLEQIRGVLETLRPTLTSDDGESAARLHSTPLLLYADNARDVTSSSLWVWEHSGKPVGVTAIEWHPSGENAGRWTFEFATLSSSRIRITLPSSDWTTESTRAAPVANAPAVGGTKAQRLQQMKQLAERFTAVEQHPSEGRLQLRRLAAPVYVHPDDSSSAIFIFANGTNPEVALLLTMAEAAENESPWAFRAAALSATDLTLLLDDRPVWNEVRFTRPGTRGTYTNGALKAEPAAPTDAPPPK